MTTSSKKPMKWLIDQDAKSLNARVTRLQYMARQFGSQDRFILFHGGMLVTQLFEESRSNFVNGQLISCVLMCQCFIEESLKVILSNGGSRYDVTDKWLARATFYNIIEKAQKAGLLTQREANDLHWLRQARVQYVHPKLPSTGKSLAARVGKENKMPWELYEKDAKRALRITFKLISKEPFIWKK